MKEHLTPSQRMTAAWGEMTKNSFELVNIYIAMNPQQVSEMIKNGNINLPDGQEPIFEYLRAVSDYLQPPSK